MESACCPTSEINCYLRRVFQGSGAKQEINCWGLAGTRDRESSVDVTSRLVIQGSVVIGGGLLHGS